MSFWGKVKAAFAIFFLLPRGDRAARGEEAAAHDPGRGPLRHVGRGAVAVGARVVEVVGEFLDVDEDAEVGVATTQDPTGESITTMYAVSIPVRGVKPQFDVENETYGWDEEPTDAPYDDDAWAEAAAAAEAARRRNDVSRGVS